MGGYIRRRAFLTLGAAAFCPLPTWAQQAKVFQIGFLYPGPEAAYLPRAAAFSEGIERAGLPPQQFNIIPAATGGDLNQLTPMATDLVRRKVDLIHAVSPAAIKAAQAATRTIPIVVSDLESDPVAAGFIASNSRPGGNITGCFLDFPEFSKKWLEALSEAVPQFSPVGVFWDSAGGKTQLTALQAAADVSGAKLIVVEVRTRADLEPAFQTITHQGARALVMPPSPFVGANTKLVAELALKHKLPSVTIFPHYATDGGLIAYGPDLMAFFRQIGGMAAKILKGAKPAELPIETPSKFEFVFNMKAAKQLGLDVSPTVMLRVDRLIE